MIYEAFLGISRCKFLFYDSILDIIRHVYKSAEYDELESVKPTNLSHLYVLYVEKHTRQVYESARRIQCQYLVYIADHQNLLSD